MLMNCCRVRGCAGSFTDVTELYIVDDFQVNKNCAKDYARSWLQMTSRTLHVRYKKVWKGLFCCFCRQLCWCNRPIHCNRLQLNRFEDKFWNNIVYVSLMFLEVQHLLVLPDVCVTEISLWKESFWCHYRLLLVQVLHLRHIMWIVLCTCMYSCVISSRTAPSQGNLCLTNDYRM